MAEVRNVFVKSKMNKDLDERLLPPGEYRDGRNISVNKSEGPDEGVVENIIGNSLYSNFNFGAGVEIIGAYVDTDRDRIFLFATNHTDSSPTQLDARAVGDVDTVSGRLTKSAVCVIAYIEGPTSSNGNVPKFDKLVEGTFLNFSKTHPILGIDMIEDLLFFTDNRNQPRKINVQTAIGASATSGDPYYTTEDQISVAKFSPVEPINFIHKVGGAWISGLIDETSEYLPANSTGIFSSAGTPGQVICNANIPQLAASLNNTVRFKNLNFPELGYFLMTSFTSNAPATFTYKYPINSNNTAAQSYDAALEAAVTYKGGTSGPPVPTRYPFVAGDVLQFERQNPLYNASYSGDKEYLRNKFIRFSYRFKYDDGEYSLMAPFTQHAFVPKQFGYILDSPYQASGPNLMKRDEKDIAESGVNKIMENQVTSIKLRVPMPNLVTGVQSQKQTFKKFFKVETIQILLKESDGLAIKVVDEIDVNDVNGFGSGMTDKFYEYDYKSEKPFKVLPEADTTRVHDKVPVRALAQAVSGNRVIYGNFIEKNESPDFLQFDISVTDKPDNSSTVFDQKEYPNHTLKQNRSYKVGVVLVDRYGRSSNVILRKPSSSVAIGGEASSIYAPYENLSSTLNWPGNNLNILFNNTIPVNKTNTYPGTFSVNNPLGYYSYKIVVQQKEQEYYNVYVPGACSGKITFKGKTGAGNLPTYPRANTTTNIVLYGDNINKVPKELADVGPTEEIYGSETLLYPRVVTKYIVSASNATAYKPTLSSSSSSQIRELNEFTVTSIISFNDLGKWTADRNDANVSTSSYPNDGTDYVDPLYLEASTNPFVAQLATNFLVGFSPIAQEQNTFSKELNVFETDPVVSKIDIFWESSSAGLISDLNYEITNGTAGLPVGISEPNFNMLESLTPGISAWISDAFDIVDDTGGAIAGATATLNVTNGYNSSIDMFEMIESPAAPTYRIRYNPTDAGVYYGSDANLRTFNFNVTATNSSGAVNTSTHEMLLSNVAPSLTNIPVSGYGTNNGGSGVVMLFVGDNGATTGNSGSWDTPFYIQANTLPNTGQGFPGCQVVRLNQYSDVVNGSGSAVSGVNQQEVSISNVAGSVNSQRLFIKTTDPPNVDWTITSDISELNNLLFATGDANPNIPGSAVNGKFLLKVNVVDAGGVGQGITTVYSSWFQILS